MAIIAQNPATGETIQTYTEMTPTDVARSIEQAHHAFTEWRRTTFAERAALLNQAARVLRDNVEEYAVLMTQEMGKPIGGARAEVNSPAALRRHQNQRLRARTLTFRHQGICQYQDGVRQIIRHSTRMARMDADFSFLSKK